MSDKAIAKMSEAERELLAGFEVSALRVCAAQRRAERRAVRQALGLVARGAELGEGERAGYFAALGLL